MIQTNVTQLQGCQLPPPGHSLLLGQSPVSLPPSLQIFLLVTLQGLAEYPENRTNAQRAAGETHTLQAHRPETNTCGPAHPQVGLESGGQNSGEAALGWGRVWSSLTAHMWPPRPALLVFRRASSRTCGTWGGTEHGHHTTQPATQQPTGPQLPVLHRIAIFLEGYPNISSVSHIRDFILGKH